MARGIRKAVKFSSGQRPNSDINVTPLVDVVLVLLIIFMVVTPLLEKDIEVRLPEEQDEHQELPPDQQSQLVVQISGAGPLFTQLVVEAFNRERITASDVSDFLSIRVKHLPEIERDLLRRPA